MGGARGCSDFVLSTSADGDYRFQFVIDYAAMGALELLLILAGILLFVPAKRLTTIFHSFASALSKPIRSLRRRPSTEPVAAPAEVTPPTKNEARQSRVPDSTGPAVLSVCVLLAALFILLFRDSNAEDKHWAYGALGTLMGFWLKK